MTVNRPLSSYVNKTIYSEDPPIFRSTTSVFSNSAPFTKCKLVKLQNIPPEFPSFKIGLLVGGLQNGEIYYFDENGEINFTLPDGMTGTNYYLVVESSTLNYANAAYTRVIFAYSLQFVFAKYNTEIDGGKQAITYYNDTEPCAVYVDGDLQENVSFVPDTVQGTGSVEYTSEYKKNHIEYEIQGATSQPLEIVKSLTTYTQTVEDYTISSYSRILRSTELISLSSGGAAVSVSLTNVSSIASSIPSNITFFLMNETQDVVNVLYMDGVSYSATVTEPFYIATADEEDGTPNQAYYDTFIQNVGLKATYTQPTPSTPLPIQNANDNGMSVVLHGKNLATAQQIYKNAGNYAEVKFEGRNCIKFTDNIKQYTTIVGGFKENTRYTVSFWAKTVSRSGAGYSIALNIVNADETRNNIYINPNTDWKKYTITTNSNTTVVRMGTADWEYRNTIYIDVDTFCIYEGAITSPVYEPYFRETVEIPTSIDVNGASVPLLFSEYDKLTVDRVNNKVIYTEGSYTRVYKGTEYFYQNSWAENSGYGRYICDSANLPVINSGLCSHFLRRNWVPSASSKNVYCVANMENGYHRLFFKTDGSIEDVFENSANEFKAFLKQQYDAGTPVTVIAKRKTPIEHDITNTDLGQSLLNLATQNQTNYFEVQGNSNAPQTPINFTFAKWGGRNENNNNT